MSANNKPLRLFAALAVSALTSIPTASFAASDAATAEALFTEARARMAKGDYATACPQLEESQKLDPGMGTLFNLADCYEHVGKTASAWAAFLEVAAQAKGQNQTVRETDARNRAAALAPKLSHVIVTVAPGDANVEGFTVKRDAIEVGKAQWGLVLPIDPGSHVVTATAPTKKDYKTTVNVPVGGRINVSIPKLEDRPAAAAPDLGPGTSAPPPSSSTQKTIGLVVVGAGGLALATGTVFGLLSMTKKNDGDKYCDGTACHNAQGVSDREDAKTFGNVSTVAFALGGAAIVGGVLLYVLAPKSTQVTSGSVRIGPVAFGRLGVGGTFQ